MDHSSIILPSLHSFVRPSVKAPATVGKGAWGSDSLEAAQPLASAKQTKTAELTGTCGLCGAAALMPPSCTVLVPSCVDSVGKA
jgi:hypothetical protein